MRRLIHWIGNIVTIILVILAVTSSLLLLQSKTHPNQIFTVGGYKPMPVLSGSMRPLLQPGDMILDHEVDPKSIKKGDVITFWANEKMLVTHRVDEVISQNGVLMFRTKGDANNVADEQKVIPQQVVGKLIHNIPKAGYIQVFVRSPHGFIFLVIIPAAILFIYELKNIWDVMKKEAAGKARGSGKSDI